MRCSIVTAKSHRNMPSDAPDTSRLDRGSYVTEKLEEDRQMFMTSGPDNGMKPTTTMTTTTPPSSTNGIAVDMGESPVSTTSSSVASSRTAVKPMSCCVHGCPINSRNSKYMSFFRFPAGPRCKLWAKFTCRKSLRLADCAALHSDKSLRICSAHFKITDFADPFFRLKLNAMAVPTVFDVSTCPWYLFKDYVPQLPTPESIQTKAGTSASPEVPFMWDSALDSEMQDIIFGSSGTLPDITATSSGAEASIAIDYSDLCAYHRMFVRSVSFVGIELEELKFCAKCGASVTDPVKMSPNVYLIKCRRGHDLLVTNEFNERCHNWLSDCNRRHRLRGDLDPACHSPCHLCDDHFVPPHFRSATASAARPPTVLSNGDCNGTATAETRPNRRVRQVRPTILPDAFPSLVRHAFRYPAETSTCDASVGFDATVDVEPDLSRVERNSKETQKSDDYEMKSSILAKQRSCILDLQARVCSLGNKAEELQKKLVNFNVSEDVIIDRFLPRFLSGVTLKLVEAQIRLSSTKRIRHWPPFMMGLAKIIDSECPKAYEIVRQLWKFPAKTEVRRLPPIPKELHSVKNFLTTYFNGETVLKERQPATKRKRNKGASGNLRKAVKVEKVPTVDGVVGQMTAEIEPTYCEPLDDQSLSTADEAAIAAEYLLHTEVPFANEEVTTMTLEEMQTFMQVEAENELEVFTSPSTDDTTPTTTAAMTMRSGVATPGFAVSNFALDNRTLVFTEGGSFVYHMVADDLLRQSIEGSTESGQHYLFQTSDVEVADDVLKEDI